MQKRGVDMSWHRTLSKRNRFHNTVGEFLFDLNSRPQESHEPLANWLGVKGPLKFISTENTDEDFRGVDFKIEHSEGVITAQDKLRQVKPGSTNASSGKDIGIEIVRMYGFRWQDDFQIVFDYGRDLCQIPAFAEIYKSHDVFTVKRDMTETLVRSDLYVVHPHNEPTVWCRSKLLKGIARSYVTAVGRDFYKLKNEPLIRKIRDSFRDRAGSSSRIDYFLNGKKCPEGVQLYVGRDVDTKAFQLLEHNYAPETPALVSKVILYINPLVLGESGCEHYIRL